MICLEGEHLDNYNNDNCDIHNKGTQNFLCMNVVSEATRSSLRGQKKIQGMHPDSLYCGYTTGSSLEPPLQMLLLP